ncbi:membrane protein insertion efficiency factor YidD [Tolypothrix sp. FACHB-123]|uniref:membrane protein insertion efficiency factor YidD n=1 Tax=Tolypothrix sp. FACHB-123 TaxID=2692868 RepID=UPI0016878595|nr:membrane protein insertion efficiency factor YidD [Tolypothrix sp. FACHB-123]MBD2353735.1 membrane protein insertion efficiency factor YidD [Tolypothrix sp. FACHB-123]
MQISLVDSLSRQVGVAAITGYQKHISPHKGFVCAHRVLYGGESCSQYIKRVVAEDGFQAAFVKSRERFQACKQANQILRSTGGGSASLSQAEDSEPTEDESDSNLHSPKKAPKPAIVSHANKSSFNSSDGTYCVDCADLGCNCAELVSMSPDCSVLDCHALDCSGADCSFLDCGGCG